MSISSSSPLAVTSFILLACLIWMDACLYYHIQCSTTADVAPTGEEEDDNDDEDSYEGRDQIMLSNRITSERDPHQLLAERKHHRQQHGQTFGWCDRLRDHQNAVVRLMRKFSFAFQGMSIKLMMTNPVDNYLLAPLAEAFADMAQTKERGLWFITPNVVSYAGVVSALIAAKLVAHDGSLALHRLSYVMFQLRTWLDDLDGTVARRRLGVHRHESLENTAGYLVDGICDAIGFVAYIIGCYIFLKKTIVRDRRSSLHPAGNRYNLESITEIKSSVDPCAYIPLPQHDNNRDNNEEEEYDDDVDAAQSERPRHHHLGCGQTTASSSDTDRESEKTGRNQTTTTTTIENLHFVNTVEDIGTYHRQQRNKGDQRGSLLAEQWSPRTGGQTVEFQSLSSNQEHQFARAKIYLEKIQNGKQSSIIFYRYIKEKFKSNLSNRKLNLLAVCFLLQLAMCAAFWNKYILVYRDLLESPSASPAQASLKSKILKSNIMFIIIWFWRLTNGHSLMQMLIASVFVGKLWQFLDCIKYIGFVEIILVATVTELHIIDIKSYLD